MKRVYLYAVLAAALSAVVLSCAGGAELKPHRVESAPALEGKFTVYLYHFKGGDDTDGVGRVVGAVAVFDREGDSYEFDLRAPDFSYIELKGLTGNTATSTAKLFLSRFKGKHVFSIIKINGETVGYEMRLAHHSWLYRKEAVGAQYYLGEDKKIRVLFRVGMYPPDRRSQNK